MGAGTARGMLGVFFSKNQPGRRPRRHDSPQRRKAGHCRRAEQLIPPIKPRNIKTHAERCAVGLCFSQSHLSGCDRAWT